MSKLFLPDGKGGFAKGPNIHVKNYEAKLRENRDYMKKKLDPLKYNVRIGVFRSFLESTMKKDDIGAVDAARLLCEMAKRKGKLSGVAERCVYAAAYDILEEKS